MGNTQHARRKRRFSELSEEKSTGATYTPKVLADFVAREIVRACGPLRPTSRTPLRILDPAVGDGELLMSLLGVIGRKKAAACEVYGFDTDPAAVVRAKERLGESFPNARLHIHAGSFLEEVLDNLQVGGQGSLFSRNQDQRFDLVISNPPYVRTQVMGADRAQLLAKQFGLAGRVDLYYAFVLAIGEVLEREGVAGIIVSNRFLTTRSGAAVRRGILDCFSLRHIWDLGDTKLFEAAVLPAVLLASGRNGATREPVKFSSIYETKNHGKKTVATPVDALDETGVVGVDADRTFLVQHGRLEQGDGEGGIWRIATAESDSWLAAVGVRTWGTFRSVGKVRVGVKTCADGVFMRSDWREMPKTKQPELLRALTTHHIARRFHALTPDKPREILYPHELVNGKRKPVDLNAYPRSRAYLEDHGETLRARSYVIEAGREWFEIWVPQNPAAWDKPKLVFRDISERPEFWIDLDKTVVNGDCYWMVCEHPEGDDLLWLAAAVGNSTFIEKFYDHRFNNKLYAGRRRFITQYVEQFPLPDPKEKLSKRIITLARSIYDDVERRDTTAKERELDELVWRAFGLSTEEVSG